MAGRVGAWENYFFEAIAIVSVLAGFRFQSFSLQRFSVKPETWNLILPIFLLVQLALMWHDPRIALNLMAHDFPANRQLATLLGQTPGIVISEDMGALATSGKEVAYYSFQYSSLAHSGKWDQRWELAGLRDAKFPVVILEHGTRENVDHYRRFTREFVSTLDRYYERAQTIGKYEIYRPAPELLLKSAKFGDVIALIGWNVVPETRQPGTIQVVLVWQAQRAMDRRYTAFVHLEKLEQGKVTQDDREPRGGAYPTTRWAVNEMVREVYTLNVPDDLSPGSFVLKVGWYDAETGERLPVAGSADDAFAITKFDVK